MASFPPLKHDLVEITPGFPSAPRRILGNYRLGVCLPQRCDFPEHRIDLIDPREPAGSRLVQSQGIDLRWAAAMQVNKPLVFVAAVTFSLGMAERSWVQAADRPNILWLIAEDFGNQLSCCGTPEVATPNLDGLAAKGVRYSRFYTTAPVCSASRSAFMTGMYQTTIGAHHHRSHRDDGYRLPAGVHLLTEWFHDGNYFPANLRELPAELGFKGTAKTDWNFTPPEKPFDSQRWADLKTHQPFYARLNFRETHRPFHALRHANPQRVEIPPYEPDHPITQPNLAAYLDAATELDRKVGLVLKQLDADGLADSTIVVCFGDNGQAHIRGKQFCYEEGLNVPLIIRWPRRFPVPAHFNPGTVDDHLLMAIDLGPTIALLEFRFPIPCKARSSWAIWRSRRVSTSSALVIDATRPHSAFARSATLAIGTSATSRRIVRSCRPTSTRRRPTRSGTC